MRSLTRLTALILLLLLCLSGCQMLPETVEEDTVVDQILSSGTLRAAISADFPPVAWLDEAGEVQGSDAELVRYLADRLGVEAEFVLCDLADFPEVLREGKADIALGGIGATESRRAAMLLSRPYYSQKTPDHVLIVPAGDVENYDSLAAFSGKRIGAQLSSIQYDLVNSQLPGAQLRPFRDLADGVALLQKGEIDVLAASASVLETLDPDFAAAPFALTDDTNGYVIALAKDNGDLLETLEGFLDTVRRQDLYNAWLNDEEAAP